jgi:transcriptional regulator with XRE-family HTH domain
MRRGPYHKAAGTETVGLRLRATRLERGLTQGRLAEAIRRCCPQWTSGSIVVMISRIESGHAIGEQTALMLNFAAQILGVDLNWLIGDRTQSKEVERSDYLNLDRPIILYIAKDGEVDYYARGIVPRNRRLLPILSVETEQIAEHLQAIVGSPREDRCIIEDWYHDGEDVGDALDRISDRFADAYKRLKAAA